MLPVEELDHLELADTSCGAQSTLAHPARLVRIMLTHPLEKLDIARLDGYVATAKHLPIAHAPVREILIRSRKKLRRSLANET